MKICFKCLKTYSDNVEYCNNDNSKLQIINSNYGKFIKGQIFNNKYTLNKLISKTATSTTWLVTDRNDEYFVLKTLNFLNYDFKEQFDKTSRFFREIYAHSKLNHPNISKLYEFGLSINNIPYILSEYIEGETLSFYISKVLFPDGLSKMISITSQIIQGLIHAHQHHVLHRDLKPSNIMITTTNHNVIAKIIDFGAAKIINDAILSTITKTEIYGTPEYLSPEQIKGEKTDETSDIYSIGILMYQIFTKTLPFTGYPSQILLEHLKKTPMPPKEFNSFLPNKLNDLILKCIKKNKEERYPNMNTLLNEINTLEK